MNIDFNTNEPIYLQIIDYIKTEIINGSFKTGEKIPSVRELAVILKVNPNTIQKALLQLEQEKIIYTERTNGKYITDDKKVIKHLKDNYAKNIINNFYESMNKIGISKEEAIKYLENGGK